MSLDTHLRCIFTANINDSGRHILCLFKRHITIHPFFLNVLRPLLLLLGRFVKQHYRVIGGARETPGHLNIGFFVLCFL